jgi:hypothetical protein
LIFSRFIASRSSRTLDEGLDQQSQEIQGEQRLDATRVFEKHRRDLLDGLDLLEALLDHRQISTPSQRRLTLQLESARQACIQTTRCSMAA